MNEQNGNDVYIFNIDIGDMTISVFGTGTVNETEYAEYTNSHFHSMYEFQYIQKNLITIADENREYTAYEGEYIIVPPGIFHSKISSDDALRYTLLFSLTPNNNINKDFSEYCFYSHALSLIKGICLYNEPSIRPIMEKIFCIKNATDPEAVHIMKIYLAELIVSFLRLISNRFSAAEQNGVKKSFDPNSLEDERIKYIIEGCIHSSFTSNELSQLIAKKLNMSSRNCTRVIRRIFGESLTELVTRQRMKLARTLIIKTQRSLTDISELIGYNTYVAFFTAFKKYYGISPTELRTK